MLKTLNADV